MFCRRRCSILLRNDLAGATHLVIYNKLPSRDWRSFLLQYVLEAQFLHKITISFSFSGGMEIVLLIVSICMPQHVTEVLGGINFLTEMSRPNLPNNSVKNL